MTKTFLVFAFLAVSYINFYQASDSPNYGTFFAMTGSYARTDLSNDNTQNIIDENFHRCSNEKSCSKVAENVKTKKYKIIAIVQEFLFEKQDARIWKREKILQIEILSAGFADASGSASIIKINGMDHSKKQRGFNVVVVLSGQNGDAISSERFDTCNTYKEADRMMSYLSSTQDGSIVLISVHHEAALSMTSSAERLIHALGATTRLTAMGGRNDTRYGGSFALVAKKGGNKPAWLAEKAEDRGKGPSRIQVQIPMGWY